MMLFRKILGKWIFQRATATSHGNVQFMSIAAMERALDGTEERFAEYYFAMYYCSPNDPDAGINERREQLRQEYPSKAIPVGSRFVLQGEPAFLTLSAYYQSLISAEKLNDDFRSYAAKRLDQIAEKHRRSQSFSLDLTEGQMCRDEEMEFFACMAISNGQVVLPELET